MVEYIIEGGNACPILKGDLYIDEDSGSISSIAVAAGTSVRQTITLNKEFDIVEDIAVSITGTSSVITGQFRTGKKTWVVVIGNPGTADDTVDLSWSVSGIVFKKE